LVSRLILSRAQQKTLGLESFRLGVPGILYFTSPACLPCKTVQRPALERLQETLGEGVQVIEVDCSARPELADYWGVLSVPTTFILDAQGRARAVNHGVTREQKLMEQLQNLAKAG
jgi:thioredoxin 1